MRITFFLVILLLFIDYSFSLKEGKDLLKEFLKTTKNEKILNNLSEKCLGNIFDYHFHLFLKSYIDNNFESITKNLENMGLDILVNCPYIELISIFTKTEYEILSPLAFKFKSKIYSKILALGSVLYSQYKNNTLTASSIGGTFGKLLNLFKFDYDALYELELEDEDEDDNTDNDSILENINNQVIDFFRGLFIGMKEWTRK